MRLAVTPDVVAALVLRERDADPVDFRLYTGPPSGPLQLRSRTRFETERIWIPVDLAAEADRVLLGELRFQPRFAYRVNVLAPGGPQQPVTWGGSLVGPVALSGERVAFLGTTRTDEDASYDHLYVIDRRSGGVEASAELRHDEDADFDDLDLAPDGRAVAALDGNLLTVAPGVAPARRTGRFSVPRFSGDGFAVLQEQRRFRARAPVLLEPNGAERILGTPSTAIGAFEADDRGAAWLANGCVLYAPRDGAPPTVSTPLARSTPAGKRVEQARYLAPRGTRVLYAQRIAGRVALVDVPLDHDDPPTRPATACRPGPSRASAPSSCTRSVSTATSAW